MAISLTSTDMYDCSLNLKQFNEGIDLKLPSVGYVGKVGGGVGLTRINNEISKSMKLFMCYFPLH